MYPAREDMLAALEQRHGRAIQEKFSKAVIAVCGLGGLGSAIAVMLARAGIGKLILIDFDRVDITNLHRQQYKADQVGAWKTKALEENLREIAPYIKTEIHNEKLTEKNAPVLLGSADIICEAFDDAGEKAMLAGCVLETMPDKYLIAASGMAGLGPADAVKTRKITGHFYLCGDGISDAGSSGGLFSTRVMLCAAHQAHMALRLLAEQCTEKERNDYEEQ